MKTERVTIRLPAAMCDHMDTLVNLGQYGTRTEVIRHALRDFFEAKGSKAGETIQAEENLAKMKQLAAIYEQNKDLFQAL